MRTVTRPSCGGSSLLHIALDYSGTKPLGDSFRSIILAPRDRLSFGLAVVQLRPSLSGVPDGFFNDFLCAQCKTRESTILLRLLQELKAHQGFPSGIIYALKISI
jgi:hypothetical protein